MANATVPGNGAAILKWALGLLQLVVLAVVGMLWRGQDKNADQLSLLDRNQATLEAGTETQRGEIVLLRQRLNVHLSGYGGLEEAARRLRADIERLRDVETRVYELLLDRAQ